MSSITELQALLVIILGSPNVYLNPPPNFSMQYPCIVFKVDDMNIKHADNKPFNNTIGYQITVMDKNPLSTIPAKIAELSTARFERNFLANGLHHTVFSIFY